MDVGIYSNHYGMSYLTTKEPKYLLLLVASLTSWFGIFDPHWEEARLFLPIAAVDSPCLPLFTSSLAELVLAAGGT